MIDLSQTLNDSTKTYPGDFKFRIIEKESVRFENNRKRSAYQIFTMKNHNGTHIDFPSHKIIKGKTSNDFPLKYFINNAILISDDDVSFPELSIINQYNVSAIIIRKESLVGELNDRLVDYICSLPKLRLIATNALTVDEINKNDVHLKLLSRDILIVEGLNNLDEVSKVYGDKPFMFYSIPLPLDTADGAPVRAFVGKI
jgi:kynurenine formamidase